MGHLGGVDRPYDFLQRRLDREVTGAPDSPALRQILELLYSPEEAALAARLPPTLATLEELAARLEMEPERLDGRLTAMAERGLVFDVTLGRRRRFALSPIVLGFFEFTFMRARPDLPMAELARLFDEYMEEGPFVASVFAGDTQLGRALVNEDRLPEGDHTEICDFERATAIVEGAREVAVSLCACRHKAGHLGRACANEAENCLSFGRAADFLTKRGMARPIERGEAQEMIGRSRRAGLVQTADNVRREVAYVCNCCSCCCGMLHAVRDFGLTGAIVSSNFVALVDRERCVGCAACAAACPARALTMEDDAARPRPAAGVAEGRCLGCAVCVGACRTGALTMQRRPRRVWTPEDVVERTVAMALERGKLADLLFGEPEALAPRVLHRVARALERSAPARALLALRPLRSAFLEALVGRARRATGLGG